VCTIFAMAEAKFVHSMEDGIMYLCIERCLVEEIKYGCRYSNGRHLLYFEVLEIAMIHTVT
jgi:hypothetical protein